MVYQVIMELLESKVLDLQAWHQANTDKIRELKDIIGPLERKNSDLRCEITQIKNEMISLSEDLQEYTKETLFRDFNKIDELSSTCGYYETFSLKLKCLEAPAASDAQVYSINIEGGLSDMCITITTASKKLMDIIRRCFINKDDSDESTFDRMNATCWYKNPYSNYQIRYNKDLAKSILCPAADADADATANADSNTNDADPNV
jgi:hypothetical protein